MEKQEGFNSTWPALAWPSLFSHETISPQRKGRKKKMKNGSKVGCILHLPFALINGLASLLSLRGRRGQ